jgi:hypothetical protein
MTVGEPVVRDACDLPVGHQAAGAQHPQLVVDCGLLMLSRESADAEFRGHAGLRSRSRVGTATALSSRVAS